MKDLPANKLNPKVKNVWRINDALWITLSCFCCYLIFFCIGFDPEAAPVTDVLCLFTLAVYVVMMVIWMLVLPPIRFVRWRYELTDEYLDIARGIIWRKRFIIPFIRVQNTDTRQGPIQRMFGLASVTVATAAGSHEIPGLDFATAETVRDKAAELARLAREDV